MERARAERPRGRDLRAGRPLAADEANSLFELGAGNYQALLARYGAHPELVARMLDELLVEPTPPRLAEARTLCSDLEVRDPRSLVAALARARIADASNDIDEAITRWSFVRELLAERGESLDATVCDIVLAQRLAQQDPDDAVTRLNLALGAEPRNRAALEELRTIYMRANRDVELEDVLKRLLGVAPDTDSLVDAYIDLAQHLTRRRNQSAEARAFLERALRIAPDRFEILDALGETWVSSGDPARAVKTLGSAATTARQRGDLRTASRLLFRVGQIWDQPMGNREQALMQVRRALEFWDEAGVDDPLGRAELLRYAAHLCESDRQQGEAIAYWTDALAALQHAFACVDEQQRGDVRRELAQTHREVAAAYHARGRHDAAVSHLRRLVEMDPTDIEALDALDQHYRVDGRYDDFIEMLVDTIHQVGPSAESLGLRTRLAECLRDLDRVDEAIMVLDEAAALAPGAEHVHRLLSEILGDSVVGPALADTETLEISRDAPRSTSAPHAETETAELSRDQLADIWGVGEIDAFREEYEEVARRPPALPDLRELEPESPLARVLQRGARRVPQPAVTPPDPEVLLSAARKSGDDRAIADALERMLGDDGVLPQRRVDLCFELAELLYYELEDGDRALPWLREVRRLDPLGYGARPGILNAIEAIFEERGSVEGQIEILTARLEQARSDDMRDTYRLLLAQLEWEERRDRDAADAWLQEVLERDDRHEGARRLCAEIAADANEWADVAEHLRVALSVSGEGLDSVELEKRLASVYLDRLGDPSAALVHFLRVLKDAPQDAGARDAIRRCQAALGDWSSYVGSLHDELEVMLGRRPGGETDDWVAQLAPDTVPGPLRIPVSHVLADIARVTQDALGQPARARDIWIQVADLWPDHVEALERRIDLDQKLEHDGA